MFTQCPECKTVFRIHAAQLQAAQGAVRCGQCSHTFDALEHLLRPATDNSSQHSDTAAAAGITTEAVVPDEQFIEDTPLADETENSFSFEAASMEQSLSDESELAEFGNPPLPEPHPEEEGEDPFSMEAHAAEELSNDNTDTAEGDTFLLNDDIAAYSSEEPVPDEPLTDTDSREWDEFSAQHIETLLTPSDESEFITEDVNELDDSPFTENSDIDNDEQSGIELNDLDDSFDLETVIQQVTSASDEVDAPLPEAEQEPLVGIDEEREAVVTTEIGSGDEDELPPQLVELEERRSGSIAATLFWFLASLLMVVAGAVQYAYFQRMQLAENEQYRPWLEQLCAIAKCDLPLRQDINRIELANHAVQSHPRYNNSLLITASIVNRADFPQHYPDVEITMTDIAQKRVATRRFEPVEYLAGSSPDGAFEPQVAVHLMLEVLDPGKDAVGFEFRFY
jgi:predicted Zn finger-like uncharacterized protein